MGSIIRGLGSRLKIVCAVACVGAALLPSHGAFAATTTVLPAQYRIGPAGGDQYNYVSQDSSGSMTVARYSVNGPSGGLGCGGSGGYANYIADWTIPDGASLSSVVVHFSQAVIDPYTWIDVALRQDGHYLNSEQDRGIIYQDGAITVPIKPSSPAHAGPVEVWFGMQTASACPNIDGGHAVFDSVDFNY